MNHGEIRREFGLGAVCICLERRRQINSEGYSSLHDDQHACGELAWAAACYAAPAPILMPDYSRQSYANPWPWGSEHDKRPSPGCSREERIRALEKAGALIAAEIDRLLRQAADRDGPKPAPVTLRDVQQYALSVAPDPGSGRRWDLAADNYDVNLLSGPREELVGWIELSSDGWAAILLWKQVGRAEDPREAMQALLDRLKEAS